MRAARSGAIAWLAAVASNSGCHPVDRYDIKLRDVQTHEPISGAKVASRYDARMELFSELGGRHLTRHVATTGADGSTCVKITPDLKWWLGIQAPGRPTHSVAFNPDGSLDQSLNKFDVQGGWIRCMLIPMGDPGSIELEVERVIREAK